MRAGIPGGALFKVTVRHVYEARSISFLPSMRSFLLDMLMQLAAAVRAKRST